MVERYFIRILMTIFILFFTIFSGLAQISFYGKVSKSKILIGEVFEISYIVEGGMFTELKLPKQDPAIKFLYGPDIGKPLKGGTIQCHIYAFKFKGISSGKVTIPSFNAQIDGKTVLLNSLSIEVIDPNNLVINSNNNEVNNNPVLSSKQQISNPVQNIEDKIKARNFIIATTDKQEYYVGEQITLQHKLYFLDEYTPSTIQRYPTVKGCFSYDLEVPEFNYGITTEKYQGKDYNALLFTKSALFASIPGKFIIDPLIVDGSVEVMIGSDLFKISKQKPIILTSKSIPITVNPLPAPPKGFSGGIGKFNISAEVDNHQVKAGEPVTLTYTVSGVGNIKLVDLANPMFTKAFETFDPTILEDVSTASGIVAGSKKFQYTLIPRVQGMQSIPATDFIYFDLGKRAYATIHLPEIILEVNGSNQKSNSSTSLPKQKDILGTKGGLVHTTNKHFFGSFGFVILSVVPFMAFFSIFLLKKQKQKNELLYAGKKALQVQLKQVHSNIGKESSEQFYISLSQLIRLFCAEQLGINTLEQTKESLEVTLLQKGLQVGDTAEIMQILSVCETALYAPQRGGDEQKLLLERTTQWMKKVEELFKENI